MDKDWFIKRHKQVGVTQRELSDALGKTPTFLTRVYSGQQRLKHDEAALFARILQVPLPEVLMRLGAQEGELARSPEVAFSGDADRQTPDLLKEIPESAAWWGLRGDALLSLGYAPGDFVLVDAALEPQPGDVVMAQVYDWGAASIRVILRVFEPPFLLAASPGQLLKPLTIGEHVSVQGVVIAAWRGRRSAKK